MFNSIFITGSLNWENVLLALGLALLLGFAGSMYYTKKNLTATRSFAFTLALLPVITATVIMVVNGNLGAGIAVAGSFSLIRFRSVQYSTAYSYSDSSFLSTTDLPIHRFLYQ